MSDDRTFMTRAIELANRGLGLTAPNPVVGCVLVKDGSIIGEGWHERAGGPHAESNAITNATASTTGSTAYVTLEPCNHQGRTGPCSQALLEAGVARVVYAVADPNAEAAGGAARLRAESVDVVEGVGKQEAAFGNRAWLLSQEYGRPYIIGKTAMSLDGRISTQRGESQWITGGEARADGHRTRMVADAIIVGAQTIIDDDPTLTARLDGQTRTPLRVIFDSEGRCSPGSKAFERSGHGALLITTVRIPSQRLATFHDMGVETLVLPGDANGRPDVADVAPALLARGIVTALIEGGGALLGSFFDQDLLDELTVYVAPKIIGGGKPAFGGRGVTDLNDAARFEFQAPVPLGSDYLYRGYRKGRVI